MRGLPLHWALLFVLFAVGSCEDVQTANESSLAVSLLDHHYHYPTAHHHTINSTCEHGKMSEAELTLRDAIYAAHRRLPNMAERAAYYNELKTTELSLAELILYVNSSSPMGTRRDTAENWEKLVPWAERMPNKAYVWSADLHPAPVGCNMGLLADINVVLHPEVDHPPFCEYYGVCRKRLNPLFGLGYFMMGFSLDPDHGKLKGEFYEALKTTKSFSGSMRLSAVIQLLTVSYSRNSTSPWSSSSPHA